MRRSWLLPPSQDTPRGFSSREVLGSGVSWPGSAAGRSNSPVLTTPFALRSVQTRPLWFQSSHWYADRLQLLLPARPQPMCSPAGSSLQNDAKGCASATRSMSVPGGMLIFSGRIR